ncbi:MAG: bis(5'-nucleosyl)-tetraphosphatase (symmetrical) YqeK, partial [Mycoplasma sp.]
NNNEISKDVSKYIIDNAIYANYWLRNYMSDKRFAHSMRVALMAKETLELNKHHEIANLGYIAGLYHDIAKEFDDSKMIDIYKKLNHADVPTKVMHGVVGAWYLKNIINYDNEMVLAAIEKHTLPFEFGSKELSILDMVLFCCDKLEHNRTNEDINNIDYFRNLLKIDINKCFNELYKSLEEQYKN